MNKNTLLFLAAVMLCLAGCVRQPALEELKAATATPVMEPTLFRYGPHKGRYVVKGETMKRSFSRPAGKKEAFTGVFDLVGKQSGDGLEWEMVLREMKVRGQTAAPKLPLVVMRYKMDLLGVVGDFDITSPYLEADTSMSERDKKRTLKKLQGMGEQFAGFASPVSKEPIVTGQTLRTTDMSMLKGIDLKESFDPVLDGEFKVGSRSYIKASRSVKSEVDVKGKKIAIEYDSNSILDKENLAIMTITTKVAILDEKGAPFFSSNMSIERMNGSKAGQ